MKNYWISLVFCLCFVLSNAQEANCKCCTHHHNQFDFWIGSWKVTNADGSEAGTNTIKKIQNNCALEENWKSAKSHFTGSSINFYNSSTQQWEQLWVDNQGNSLHLKGERQGNQMILQSDMGENKDGDPFFNRITWTLNSDGTVRQLWEIITNENNVAVAFDGLYEKILP